MMPALNAEFDSLKFGNMPMSNNSASLFSTQATTYLNSFILLFHFLELLLQ